MCSVDGCDSWRHNAQRFKLPEDPERRLEWVQFVLEVNGQRLKESSWTDITICRLHFTQDCFINQTQTGTVQLKSSAVPSLCVKSEPEEPEVKQEPEETLEVDSKCDQLEKCVSPPPCFEESEQTSDAAQQSPAPSEASEPDYGQMIQKVANIDIIRKKAALLQMKGKYVVNEKRLLQLFSPKCPLCGSKVKTEKVTYGVVIILNQQCLECDYGNQWKSQVNAKVPTAEEQHLVEEVEVGVTPETQQKASTDGNHSTITGVSEIVDVTDEGDDSMDETEESSDKDDMDSDDDWNPEDGLLEADLLFNDSEVESEDERKDYDQLPTRFSELCTECGKFFHKRKPHTCEHKIKPYSCNICGKRCVTEVALNTHSRIHDENYEHPCKYCHATFKTKVDKITHEQIHITEEKPYKCPDCSETFATNKKRRIHLVNHRGPRLFKCHICGMEFTRTVSLKRHIPVHTGLKRFKCSVCQRGFSQSTHLKSHMRLHTGEKPYKCQHCEKCFTHNVSLKSHVQRYHISNSGRERKKGNINKTVSGAVDAQENGNERVTDSGLDNVEKEQDTQENMQMNSKAVRKAKHYRSTGRPLGRPKRNAAGHLVLAGEMQDRRSNTKTAKAKAQKLKRSHYSDEESEDELTESDMSFDSTEEEEENSDKVTSSTSRSKRKAKNPDSDSDFDPEERQKKRHSSQNSGKNSGKCRGRPRKNQAAKDT